MRARKVDVRVSDQLLPERKQVGLKKSQKFYFFVELATTKIKVKIKPVSSAFNTPEAAERGRRL